ncbi:epithelial sodium channel subunit alpha-like [Babylonia areolata]|uniref:epithelial sodium channel subunit alpha-like n=1 Tax=Babylonia areolata TaxID=304850 RepID=UPI003FD6739C
MGEEEDRTVRGVGRAYLQDSSVGGVRRAARPNLVVRIVWVAIIVVSASVAVYSVVRLVTVRAQRRRAVTSGVDDTRSVTFPDVTVCDVRAVQLNRVRRVVNKASSRLLWGLLIANLSLYTPLNEQSEAQNRQLRHQYQTLVDQLSSEERDKAGFVLQDRLTDCALGDAPCEDSNFTRFYHHKYGNCYTFSPDSAHQDIWLTGPQHGLILKLMTSLNDVTQEEAGFVIGVHQSRDTPFLPEEGFFVPAGQVTYVSLTKSTQSLESDCVDEEEDSDRNLYAADTGWRYSQRGCQHGCLQRELYDRCDCCDLDLPCPSTFLNQSSNLTGHVAAPRCSSEEELSCRSDVTQSYTDSSLPCLTHCPSRCRQTRFPGRVSISTLIVQQSYPTDGGRDEATALLSRAALRRKRGLEFPTNPSSADSMVRIHVYFEDLRTPTADVGEDIDWSEWLADIGGLLSLWLGLSVLGVLEVFHMLLELASLLCCRAASNPVTHVTPFSP